MSCPGWASGQESRRLSPAWTQWHCTRAHSLCLSLLTVGLLLKRVSLVITVGMIPGQSSSAHSPLASYRVRVLGPQEGQLGWELSMAPQVRSLPPVLTVWGSLQWPLLHQPSVSGAQEELPALLPGGGWRSFPDANQQESSGQQGQEDSGPGSSQAGSCLCDVHCDMVGAVTQSALCSD